jgi:uncharacterized protein YndB with AHSA1/START domain
LSENGPVPTGYSKDAGWQFGLARTLAVPHAALWHFVSSPPGLAPWLGTGANPELERGAAFRTDDGVTGEIRSYHPGSRIRATLGSTTVQITVTPGATGTRLSFLQERMASAEERERQRGHWQRVMREVAELLDVDVDVD